MGGALLAAPGLLTEQMEVFRIFLPLLLDGGTWPKKKKKKKEGILTTKLLVTHLEAPSLYLPDF